MSPLTQGLNYRSACDDDDTKLFRYGYKKSSTRNAHMRFATCSNFDS